MLKIIKFNSSYLARVPRHLQQEEASVALWQKVIRWIVLVQHLQHKVTSPEIGNSPGQPRPSPHEPQEQGSLLIRKLLHDVPEPSDQR